MKKSIIPIFLMLGVISVLCSSLKNIPNDVENYKNNISQAIELSKKYYPNEFQSEQDLVKFTKKIDRLRNKSID